MMTAERLVTNAAGREEDLVLEVRNEGDPIAPDVFPHLFEPFRRGHRDGSGVRESLGLGLFIVKQIVEAHGGQISVTSTPEEGTTFTVRLPRRPQPRKH